MTGTVSRTKLPTVPARQFDLLASHASTRQPRRLGHGLFPVDQRAQHRPAGDTKYVAGNSRRLDAGTRQQLDQSLPLRCLGRDQLAAIAPQIAQIADRTGRHETCRDQAMTREVADPIAVLRVRLASGNILDVLSVADNQFEMPSSSAYTGFQ